VTELPSFISVFLLLFYHHILSWVSSNESKRITPVYNTKHSFIILSHFTVGPKAFPLDKDDFTNFGKYVSTLGAEFWEVWPIQELLVWSQQCSMPVCFKLKSSYMFMKFVH